METNESEVSCECETAKLLTKAIREIKLLRLILKLNVVCFIGMAITWFATWSHPILFWHFIMMVAIGLTVNLVYLLRRMAR